MSKSPPDARNILVTLDGVVQYPSDTSTTRAYSVTENTISFASAPGTGVAIQVRHIGFSGSAASGGTNLVTSVFGRTGDVVLTNADDVTVRNVTAGIGTFASASITGNLSVGGVLTYQDVTNVDSLGIGTFRTGVRVLAGGIVIAGISTLSDTTQSTSTTTGAATFAGGVGIAKNLNVGGTATATLFSGPSQVGIQSGGVQIGAGITQLNFIGTGNTFAVSGTTVDISISGGSAGAGGTWGSNAVGVHTDKIVGKLQVTSVLQKDYLHLIQIFIHQSQSHRVRMHYLLAQLQLQSEQP